MRFGLEKRPIDVHVHGTDRRAGFPVGHGNPLSTQLRRLLARPQPRQVVPNHAAMGVDHHHPDAFHVEGLGTVLLPFVAAVVPLTLAVVPEARVGEHPVDRRPAAGGAVGAAQAARHIVRFHDGELLDEPVHLSPGDVVPDADAERHGQHHDQHERSHHTPVQRGAALAHEFSGTKR